MREGRIWGNLTRLTAMGVGLSLLAGEELLLDLQLLGLLATQVIVSEKFFVALVLHREEARTRVYRDTINIVAARPRVSGRLVGCALGIRYRVGRELL